MKVIICQCHVCIYIFIFFFHLNTMYLIAHNVMYHLSEFYATVPALDTFVTMEKSQRIRNFLEVNYIRIRKRMH